jgi:hypothetical protein
MLISLIRLNQLGVALDPMQFLVILYVLLTV